jgi:hypothetical protein
MAVILGELIGPERGTGRLIIEPEAPGDAAGTRLPRFVLMIVRRRAPSADLAPSRHLLSSIEIADEEPC